MGFSERLGIVFNGMEPALTRMPFCMPMYVLCTVDCLTNETDEVRPCIGRLDFTEDTATYSPGWLNTTSGNASWVYSSADRLDT